MPRKSRSSRSAPKRRYQWFGGLLQKTVETVAGTSVSDITPIRPSHGSLDAMRRYRIERLLLSISISREGIAVADLLNFAVFIQQTDSAGNFTDVLQIQDTDAFVYANTAILHMSCLSAPGVILNLNQADADVVDVTREIQCHNFDFKPRRNIDLAREAIGLQINSDVGGVFLSVSQWRLLLSS